MTRTRRNTPAMPRCRRAGVATPPCAKPARRAASVYANWSTKAARPSSAGGTDPSRGGHHDPPLEPRDEPETATRAQPEPEAGPRQRQGRHGRPRGRPAGGPQGRPTRTRAGRKGSPGRGPRRPQALTTIRDAATTTTFHSIGGRYE